MVLVSDERKSLESPRVRASFQSLEPIQGLVLREDDAVVVATYFARIGHGYRHVSEGVSRRVVEKR
jgi:hypothetical protein